jgi:hypothetical protein
MVRVQFVLGNASVKGLIRRPDCLAAFHATCQLRPHVRIYPHSIFRQDPDMLAEPVGFDGDVALQRLGDLVQHRLHVHVQGRAIVMGQELAGEAEAEGLLAADPHRRERVGFIGQPEPVPGVVICQRSAFLIPQKVQITRHGAPGHAQLGHEVRAVGRIPTGGTLPHHLYHAPDPVILRP